MGASIVVTPRGHWVNGWFLRLLSRAVVRVDGVDHDARWGRPCRVQVAPGAHQVAVGARYRGTSSVLGVQEATIEVAEGQHAVLDARNGFVNHQPFTIAERAEHRGPPA